MTINKINTLELKELEEKNPQLFASLQNGEPIGKAWLAGYIRGKALSEEAIEQAKHIQKEVTKSPLEQNSLMVWCGYPTDMTRCNPFFPINKKNLGNRDNLKDFVITSANWGEITYTGPKLSTYEEDLVIVILALLEGVSEKRKITEVEGRKTYTYKGALLPLLKLLGYEKPNKKDYSRILESLKLLKGAQVTLFINNGKTKSGKKRPPKLIHMTNMLSSVVWDEEAKELSVTINPFFYEAYVAKTVTSLDVKIRSELKGPVAKALYRFIQSHRKNPVFKGHFLTLSDALNMDRSQPSIEIRRTLKKAILELISKDTLTKKSKFVDQDIILLERNDLKKIKKSNQTYKTT